jgi:hypothetical protein
MKLKRIGWNLREILMNLQSSFTIYKRNAKKRHRTISISAEPDEEPNIKLEEELGVNLNRKLKRNPLLWDESPFSDS